MLLLVSFASLITSLQSVETMTRYQTLDLINKLGTIKEPFTLENEEKQYPQLFKPTLKSKVNYGNLN